MGDIELDKTFSSEMIMSSEPRGCDQKAPMNTLLAPAEKRFIQWLAPHFPAWVETWQLTMLTVPWKYRNHRLFYKPFKGDKK